MKNKLNSEQKKEVLKVILFQDLMTILSIMITMYIYLFSGGKVFTVVSQTLICFSFSALFVGIIFIKKGWLQLVFKRILNILMIFFLIFGIFFGLLMLLSIKAIFIDGVLNNSVAIFFSSLCFIVISVYYFVHNHRNKKRLKDNSAQTNNDLPTVESTDTNE